MPSASVTSKGQITLPKEVREALGVRTGDRVAFRAGSDGRYVIEAETLDLWAIKGAIKPRRQGVTIEDMKRAVRRRGAGAPR
jgi:antitoxin PrlF